MAKTKSLASAVPQKQSSSSNKVVVPGNKGAKRKAVKKVRERQAYVTVYAIARVNLVVRVLLVCMLRTRVTLTHHFSPMTV